MANTLVISRRVDEMLLRHIAFLSRVSLPVAKKFRNDYAVFPVETDLNLPEEAYRKALFARRYKAVFLVEKTTVYLDAVIDCRQEFDDEMERHS